MNTLPKQQPKLATRFENELGASMTEMVVFTAIIVVALGGAILYLQTSSQQRIEKGQAVFSAHELRDPALAASSSSSGGATVPDGHHPVVVDDGSSVFVPDHPDGDEHGGLSPENEDEEEHD